MGLFKSKKEDISELPTLPSLDDNNFNLGVPESPPGFDSFNSRVELGVPPVEVHSLPNLPFSGRQESNQEIIKNAVTNNRNNNFQNTRNNNLLPRASVVSSIVAEPFEQEDEEDEFRAKEFSEESVPVKRYVKKTEPIYVRLDKFETTVQSFEEIKNKIFEIEKLLGKIKDIKSQEEKELNQWESEVQAIRARIDNIDKDVFGKLD